MATATEGLIESLRTEVPGAIAEGDRPLPPGPKIDRVNGVTAEHPRVAGARSPEERSNLGDLPPARAVPMDLVGPLDDEASSRIRGENEQYGLEALAWYRSYHWGIYRGWGIYVREVGILHAATEIASRQGGELEAALGPARDLLIGHEMLHFYADIAATSLEIALGSPLYVPRHRHQAPGYDPLEEALANAHALTRLAGRRTKTAAAGWLSTGPVGYRDFASYVRPDDWRDGVRTLMGSILSAGAGPTRGLPVLESLLDRTNKVVSEADVPVWLVRDAASGSGLRFVTKITEIIETQQFQKQLKKRGDANLAKAWKRARNLLEVNVTHPGLNFEKLKGDPDRYSVRLNQSDRAVLHLQDKCRWVAERIGGHDVAYR